MTKGYGVPKVIGLYLYYKITSFFRTILCPTSVGLAVIVLFFNSNGIADSGNSENLKILSSLSPNDKIIWKRGEINEKNYIGGAVLGTIVGFGSGHSVQRRFWDRGSYFLVGETIAIAAFETGGFFIFCGIGHSTHFDSGCEAAINTSLAIFLGLKIWEIYDLWFIPPIENARYRELKNIHKPSSVTVLPTLFPLGDNGIALGLLIGF